MGWVVFEEGALEMNLEARLGRGRAGRRRWGGRSERGGRERRVVDVFEAADVAFKCA